MIKILIILMIILCIPTIYAVGEITVISEDINGIALSSDNVGGIFITNNKSNIYQNSSIILYKIPIDEFANGDYAEYSGYETNITETLRCKYITNTQYISASVPYQWIYPKNLYTNYYSSENYLAIRCQDANVGASVYYGFYLNDLTSKWTSFNKDVTGIGYDYVFGGMAFITDEYNIIKYNTLGDPGTVYTFRYDAYTKNLSRLNYGLSDGGAYHQRNSIFTPISTDSNTNLYMNNYKISRSSYELVNITNSKTFSKGIYDKNNALAYFINWEADTSYPNKLYLARDIDNIDATLENMNTKTGCNDILSLSNIHLNDIYCKTLKECYAVGSYDTDNKALLFQFNDTYCQWVSLNQSFTITQKPLYNVIYSSYADNYYIVGNGVFFSINAGIIYNTTTTSNDPVCYNSEYLCTIPIYIGNNIQCDIDNLVYCNQGCIDDECLSTELCSDECIFNNNPINVIGYKECTSSTGFSVCGNYDADDCLELQNYYCANSEVCSLGLCINSTPTNNEVIYESFNIIPQFTPQRVLISSETIAAYDFQRFFSRLILLDYISAAISIIPTVTVHDKYDNNILTKANFAITGTPSTYQAYNCDYKESRYYNDDFSIAPINNGWQGKAYNIAIIDNNNLVYINESLEMYKSFNTLNNSMIGFYVKPLYNYTNNYSLFGLTLYNDNTDIKTFYVSYNYTDFSVCTYISNMSGKILLFCDYGIADNYKGTANYITANTLNDKYSIASLNNYGKHYSASFNSDNYSATYNKIGIRMIEGQAYFDNIVINTMNTFPSVETIRLNDNNAILCTYTSNGEKNIRVYNMPYANPTYDNFIDYFVNIHLRASNETIPDYTEYPEDDIISVMRNSELSKGMRLLYALIIIFIITLIAGMMTYIISMGNKILTTMISLFSFIGTVTFFTIGEWISSMIIIIAAILCAGIIFLFFYKLFFNPQGG